MDERTSELRRTVTQRLGEAMLAAVGLFVGQYLGEMSGGKKEEAEETFSAFLPPQEFFEAAESSAEQRNESFDMRRFTALRGAAEEATGAKTPAPTEKAEAAQMRYTSPAAEQLPTEQAEGGRTETLHAVLPGETAESISRRFETDARRYDAGFELY